MQLSIYAISFRLVGTIVVPYAIIYISDLDVDVPWPHAISYISDPDIPWPYAISYISDLDVSSSLSASWYDRQTIQLTQLIQLILCILC